MMAADIRIVRAERKHIKRVARRMRQADRDEVTATGFPCAAQALAHSLRHSGLAYTVLINGRAEAMFGVGDINILAGIGGPWFLGTDALDAHRMAFLRGSRRWLPKLLARYEVLRNFVDVRNTASVRWLRWLGFTLSEPVEMNGYLFHLFEMRA